MPRSAFFVMHSEPVSLVRLLHGFVQPTLGTSNLSCVHRMKARMGINLEYFFFAIVTKNCSLERHRGHQRSRQVYKLDVARSSVAAKAFLVVLASGLRSFIVSLPWLFMTILFGGASDSFSLDSPLSLLMMSSYWFTRVPPRRERI